MRRRRLKAAATDIRPALLMLVLGVAACWPATAEEESRPHGRVVNVVTPANRPGWGAMGEVMPDWRYVAAITESGVPELVTFQTRPGDGPVQGADKPNLLWELGDNTATRVIWTAAAPQGERVFVKIRGTVKIARRPGGGGQGGAQSGQGNTVPAKWETNSIDLDLDADIDGNGKIDDKVDEDKVEKISPGALAVIGEKRYAPLLLRQVKPSDRPRGKVTVERSMDGDGRAWVDVQMAQGNGQWVSVFPGAQSTVSQDLWSALERAGGGGLALRAVGLKPGEALITARYRYEPRDGSPVADFADVVRVKALPFSSRPGALTVVDCISGQQQADDNDTNHPDPALYACERLEYERDANGNRKVKGGRLQLVFDYPPPTGGDDPERQKPANYRWSLTLDDPGGGTEEVASGGFAAGMQGPTGLSVSETRRLYTLTAWYQKGQGPNAGRLDVRQVRIRVLGIVARGFGPVEPSRYDWSLSFQDAAPGGSWFSQEGYNRFAFRHSTTSFGHEGMDVFFRARYGSVDNRQPPAGEMAEVNNMTWEPQAIAALEKRYEPAKPQGPGMPNRGVWMPMLPPCGSINAHYVGLLHDKFPPDNGGFGLKQVDITVGDATWQTPYWAHFDPAALLTNKTRTDCSIAADEAAERRLAALRSVGTYSFPAWYYYWSKELGGVCDFSIAPDGDDRVFTTEYVRFGLPGGLPDDIAKQAVAVCQPTGKIYFSADFQKFRSFPTIPPNGTPNCFRWPEKLGAAMPKDSRYFSWRVQTLTDKINVVVAHERTHRVCFQKTPDRPGAPLKPGQQKDGDGDRVPDDWEQAVGLDLETHSTYSTFTNFKFTLYSPNGAKPDNEFYAWINAAFSPHYEGVVLDADGTDIRDKLLKGFSVGNKTHKYYGIVPKPSRRDLDWSAGGGNWDMGSGE